MDENTPYDPGANRGADKALALVLLSLLLLVAGVSAYWRIQSDSALYVGIAKSLATGEGYTFSGEPQHSIPPAGPILFALVHKAVLWANPAAPVQDVISCLNALSAVVALAGIVVACLLIRALKCSTMPVLALALLALNQRYFALSLAPLTDLPYCLVSWSAILALVAMERRGGWGRTALAAVLVALAPLTRGVGISLALAVAVYAVLTRARANSPAGRRRFIAAALPALIVSAVFVWMILSHRGGPAFNYWDDLVTGRTGGEMAHRLFYDIATVPDNIFEAVVGFESAAGAGFVFAALLILGAARCWRKGGALVALYTVLYLLWVALGEKVRPRYVVPVLPFVYVFMLEGARGLLDRLSSKYRRVGLVGRAAAAVMLVVVLATNTFYIGREIHLSHAEDFYASYRHGKWADYIELGRRLDPAAADGRIMTLQFRVVHVLSGAPTTALPYHPETRYRPSVEETLEYARSRGVTAVLIDPADAESAAILEDFLWNGPLEVGQPARFGRLALYPLEYGDSAAAP
ncbi:MAG: hypothetical protein ACYTAN_12305 [Planctomycetota bacterium]|jgi:hypothetical protein